MLFMWCSFENLLSNIISLLGHVQLCDIGSRKGREWDSDEMLDQNIAIPVGQVSDYTADIVSEEKAEDTEHI